MAKHKKRKKSGKLKSFPIIGALILLAVLGGGIFYSRKHPEETFIPQKVKIGLIAELSGQYKQTGQSAEKAAQLAVDDINTEGGVKIGSKMYPVELITKDNKGSIDITEEEVRDLVQIDSVVAIIGPNIDTYTIPAANVANSLKTVLISPLSSNSDIIVDPATKEVNRYIFRTTFSDTTQTNALASFTLNNLHLKKAAIISDQDDPVSTSRAELFKQAFEAKEGKISSVSSFSAKNYDYLKVFSSIINNPPDIIFLPVTPPLATNFIKQAHYLGIKAQFLGDSSWKSDQLLTVCAKECEGVFLPANFSSGAPIDEAKTFSSEFQHSYNVVPDETAALTYDSFGLVFQNLENGDKVDSQMLRDNLSQTNNYLGVTGTISYGNGIGNPKKSVSILQVKDGKFTYNATINP